MATDTVMQNDPNDAFAKMTDEEIVLESQQHDNVLAQEYLLHKYRNFVRAKARSYFLIGAEREDIIQEGMIGLIRLSVISVPTSRLHFALLLSCV